MSERKELPTVERCETCKFYVCAGPHNDDMDEGDESVPVDEYDPTEHGRAGICRRYPPVKTMDEPDELIALACYPVARPWWWCGEYQPTPVPPADGQ